VSRTIAVTTIVLALGTAVALAACGSAASSTLASARSANVTPSASSSSELAAATTGRSSTGPRATAASHAPSVRSGSSRYGRVLFDGGGRVLYTFARDRGTASTCYGPCAAAWPPFTVNRVPTAGAGVSSRLVGTTRRGDGSLQVTYAGHPLYYYTGDKKPGQILCQNVSSFGGLWLVVNPNGTPVH
jgi:predicted lipoprotein with Yx(FWY)xxD motif